MNELVIYCIAIFEFLNGLAIGYAIGHHFGRKRGREDTEPKSTF